jgi:hypothetical protein
LFDEILSTDIAVFVVLTGSSPNKAPKSPNKPKSPSTAATSTFPTRVPTNVFDFGRVDLGGRVTFIQCLSIFELILLVLVDFFDLVVFFAAVLVVSAVFEVLVDDEVDWVAMELAMKIELVVSLTCRVVA